MRPIIVDLFAGGGGASMGIEMALGRAPDVAINHDPVAIAMHEVNHPETEHYCNDIWEVDPARVRPCEPVGLLWASPDCKHFSKAKGGKPKDRNIRDLAWVVVKWAEIRKPDVIIVENVEEFSTWGPLDNDGRIIPEFAGQTFEDWLGRLKRCGYKVEWRESRASSYGAPTIRKRLCIVASRLGKPKWPKATHGDPKAKDFNAKAMQPWRTAAEDVIDWSLVCPSIFDTKEAIWERHGLRAVRPLAKNTGARVARGVRRYVLDSQRPFLVHVAHGSVSPDGKVKRWGDGAKPADEPLGSVTAGGISQAVVVPTIVGCGGRAGQSRPRGGNEPLATITAKADACIAAPHLMTMRNAGKPFQGADEPTHTVTAGGAGLSMVAPVLTYAQQGGNNRPADEPTHTITASGKDQNQVIAASLVQTGYGEREGQEPRALDPQAPLGTVVAGGAKHAAVAAHIMRQFGGSIGHDAAEPTGAITAGVNKTGVVATFLAQHNNDSRRIGGVNPGRPVDEPLSTITVSGAQQGVVAAHLTHLYTSNTAGGEGSPEKPLKTVTAGGGHHALISGALVKYYGTGDGQSIDEALHTVTVKDRFGLAELALAAPPFGAEHEARAREVADFMREHGQWDGGEFVTLEIEGATFVIADIGLRMLTPRELFNAQGFPRDYRIDRDNEGRVFSKSDQIGRAGNSVSPPWAAAHVAANCAHLVAEPAMEAAE